MYSFIIRVNSCVLDHLKILISAVISLLHEYFQPIVGFHFSIYCFHLKKNPAKMITEITCAIHVVFLYTMFGFGSTELYHKMARHQNCTLVMMCNSHEAPARSKIECYVVSKGMAGTGAYYSPPTGICSMCLPPSTMTSFVARNKDMDCYSVGR